LNSPAVKAFGDERIASGEHQLVVDLEVCTGMDSTFMGTLAGMAARLSAMAGGVLQIAEPGERNRRSLEDLGLDFLMEIDPPSATWRGKVESIRKELRSPQAGGALDSLQRTRHVLEAHQTLSDVNHKNAREFSKVVDILENELTAKETAAEKDKPE
jgi:anti-anti-sigma regulatory factor